MTSNPLAGDSGEIITELPATGAWLETHDPGTRRFAHLGPLELASGERLDVTLAYETWGTFTGDNAVLLCHPLTGDAHACGGGGWWEDVVGPGKPIDTDRFYVVCANVLGGCQGSTGPASLDGHDRRYGARFPRITVRDQVNAEAALAAFLGVTSWVLVAGASAGGHRVMEWGATYPHMCHSLAVLVSAPVTTGEQIAYAHQQIQAIELDPAYRGGDYYEAGPGDGPHRGLGLARAMAHTTYRCPAEFNTRFGNTPQDGEDPNSGGRFAAGSYLDYHGNKLAARFDATSYIRLTETMMTHDITRGSASLDEVLAGFTMDVLVVAVDSDRLFFPDDVRRLADLLPSATFEMVHSNFGHDGFLVESDQVCDIIARFVARVAD